MRRTHPGPVPRSPLGGGRNQKRPPATTAVIKRPYPAARLRLLMRAMRGEDIRPFVEFEMALKPGATLTLASALSRAGGSPGRRLTVWMALLVVASAAWGIFRDCHMPVANGLGYDGATYGQIALEPESIFQLPFN